MRQREELEVDLDVGEEAAAELPDRPASELGARIDRGKALVIEARPPGSSRPPFPEQWLELRHALEVPRAATPKPEPVRC
jgi:hypothetical protein